MRDPRRFIAPIALLLAAIPAAAQLRDGEWVSYRDAYRAMVRFEKFGGPKNLLVSRLRVQPGDHAPVTEGAQLTLNGKSSRGPSHYLSRPTARTDSLRPTPS
jgi:hypothetical protein